MVIQALGPNIAFKGSKNNSAVKAEKSAIPTLIKEEAVVKPSLIKRAVKYVGMTAVGVLSFLATSCQKPDISPDQKPTPDKIPAVVTDLRTQSANIYAMDTTDMAKDAVPDSVRVNETLTGMDEAIKLDKAKSSTDTLVYRTMSIDPDGVPQGYGVAKVFKDETDDALTAKMSYSKNGIYNDPEQIEAGVIKYTKDGKATIQSVNKIKAYKLQLEQAGKVVVEDLKYGTNFKTYITKKFGSFTRLK